MMATGEQSVAVLLFICGSVYRPHVTGLQKTYLAARLLFGVIFYFLLILIVSVQFRKKCVKM